MTLLHQIETRARQTGSRLVLLNLPDFWRLTLETKLLGCGCSDHKCVAVPPAIATDNVKILPYPSFDREPQYLTGK